MLARRQDDAGYTGWLEMRTVPTSEIIELYVNHELSSTEIGRRVGLTRQAVHARLKTAGVATRSNEEKPPAFEKDSLERLYVQDQLTFAEVADKLARSGSFWNLKKEFAERVIAKFDTEVLDFDRRMFKLNK